MHILPIAALAAVIANSGSAPPDRSLFVSDASHVLGSYRLSEVEHTPEATAAAARHFLESLDSEQRERVGHTLDSDERREWTNLPAPGDAGGLRLGDCDPDQVAVACDLMAALFSEQGFVKMRDIMLADDQLLRDGRARPGFGTENFSIVIFGTPSPSKPWAFQIDGHHVGVNLAMHGDDVTMSPSFIGTQPHAFTIGERTITPLAGELSDATALAATLTDAQRAAAVIGDQRQKIRTGPGHDHEVPAALGVSCSTFDDTQRALLLSLIGRWVNDLPPIHAKARMEHLATEIDEMHFAWAGPTSPGSDISFSVQGPTLVIEYACQDLGGDPLDHLHTMYRDPTNEYGGQLEGHDHDH